MPLSTLSDERHTELAGALRGQANSYRAHLGFDHDQDVSTCFLKKQLDRANRVQILRHTKPLYPFWP